MGKTGHLGIGPLVRRCCSLFTGKPPPQTKINGGGTRRELFSERRHSEKMAPLARSKGESTGPRDKKQREAQCSMAYPNATPRTSWWFGLLLL